MEEDQQPAPPGVEPVVLPPHQPPQPPPAWMIPPPVNMQQQFQQFQHFQWLIQNMQPGAAASQQQAAPAQPQPVASAPPRLTLTPFWPSNPAPWFRLAEGAFNTHHVTDSNLRFDLVLPALPEPALNQLRDILRIADTLTDPYETLKKELIRLYMPNKLDQLNRLIFSPELGAQQPSQLMQTFLANLPEGEPEGLIFKHLWMMKLPEDLRDQVAKKIEQLDARQLAEYADTRWHVRNARRPPGKAVAAFSVSDDVEELVWWPN